jgi:uncharacterized membrane protein
MSLVPVHVVAGTIAILTGFVALFAVKGLPLHRKTGRIFVYAMLVMSLSGAVIAIGRFGAAMNIPAGLVTAYLVVTALLTVQRTSPRIRQAERGAMVAAFVLALVCMLAAFNSAVAGQTGFAVPLVIFGAVVFSAGVGDRRMLRAGGVQGNARLRRHLWRMCLGLFIASASFFLGPVRRIPEPLRMPAFRLIPFVALATMAYWLWRYRGKNRMVSDLSPASPPAHRLYRRVTRGS